MADKLEISAPMQESLLTLLCMDNNHAAIIRNSLPAASFEGIYGDIARAVYPYVDKHKKAPRNHLDEVLDNMLRKKDSRTNRVKKTMKTIKKLHKSKLNTEYLMSRLDQRLRHHNIKKATRDLMGIFNAGLEDDSAIDQMEDILTKAIRNRVETFSPGLRLGDKEKAKKALTKDETEDSFPTGIKELDEHHLGPKRKQLHILTGTKKIGKTRWLVQCGEKAALVDARVLHISLEMDEERMLKRYYQSFFGIAKVRKEVRRKKFKKDEDGKLISIRERESKVRMTLEDKHLWRDLKSRLNRWDKQLNNIIIKSFPTRQLSFRDLVAYLDRLEIQENFVPDVLIIDYPKLMKINIDNMRLSLGALLEDLRGLGVERNMAIVTVAQAHRTSKDKAGTIDGSNIGEDFSQTQTLDTGLVFRQTKMEAELGLARILVDDARDAPSGWEVLIATNYDQGQFSVDSVRMEQDYNDLIAARAGVDTDDD